MGGFTVEAGVPPGFASPQWNSLSFCSDFGRRLYGGLTGEWLDASFHIRHQGRPVLALHCTLSPREVAFYKLPTLPCAAPGLSPQLLEGALDVALDRLQDLARGTAEGRARLWNAPPVFPAAPDSPLDQACSRRGAISRPWEFAVADLALSEDELRRDLRDSYRSLVNWGRRSLEMEVARGPGAGGRLWEDYVPFYQQVAGSVMPDPYWQAMADELEADRGEVILGRLDGRLLSSLVVIETGPVACYLSAAYDRDHFDKPLGHWPLYMAMLRAKERGCRWFNLGHVPAGEPYSAKEVNIGKFKRGFTSRRSAVTEWVLPSAP